MRNLLFILCFFAGINANAQTASDLFNTESTVPVYWCGIDFSSTKLVDVYDQEPQKIQEVYFKSINHLLVTEREKFSVEKMFYKESVDYNIQQTDSVIDLINPELLEAKEANKIAEDKINDIVSAYDFSGYKQGIGVMLIAEYFNKTVPEAAYVLVAVKTDDNTILLKERFTTKPAGFGFRNYWAGSVYAVFKQSGKSFKKWKNKYSE